MRYWVHKRDTACFVLTFGPTESSPAHVPRARGKRGWQGFFTSSSMAEPADMMPVLTCPYAPPPCSHCVLLYMLLRLSLEQLLSLKAAYLFG